MSSALKIWQQDDTEAVSLREIWETMEHEPRTESTVSAIRTTLDHWEEFCRSFGGGCTSTTSTCAVSFTDELVSQWQKYQISKGLAFSTINKQWRHIRSIVRRAGPRETGNPRGRGKIRSVPWLAPLLVPRRPASILTLDQIDSIYDACSIADWPSSISPPEIWRGIVVCAYCLGMHFSDLANLQDSSYTLETSSPDPDSSGTSPWGWLSYQRQKVRSRELVIPLPRAAAVRLKAASSLKLNVFGFSARQSRSFYRTWSRIRDAAGLPSVEFRSLRKTSNNTWNRIRPGLGKWVLGHAARGVNEEFYTNIEPELIEAVVKFPVVDRWCQPPGPEQMWLFK